MWRRRSSSVPKKVHDLAMKLKKEGYSEDSSWAIANSKVGPNAKKGKTLIRRRKKRKR